MAIFALLALFVSAVVANDCSISPIYVDYHARLVDGGLNYQYGLFIGVGTASQNQSLWPSLLNNDTYLASFHYCDGSQYSFCRNETHGFYFPPQSTSSRGQDFQHLDTNVTNGVEIEETVTDVLNIFTHYFDPSPPNVTVVPNFPITVLTNWTKNSSPWFGPSGKLGLGSSSKFLKALFDLNYIASRSFGFYVGTAYERAGGVVNGSLTIGGHDSGRWYGNLYDFVISPVISTSDGSTPFKVTVDSVKLLRPDNSTQAQLNDQPFDAYISTDQFAISLPKAATDNFMTHTQGSANINPYDNTFQLPPGFDGSLSITLSNGATVIIPNHDLKNNSNISPISTLPSDGPSAPILGTAFLSTVYLMVQYDASPPSFHLANASLPGPYVQTQPLCPGIIPTPAQAPKVNSFVSNGIVGAILGGVIGGIGLTFALWYSVRRHFQKKAHRKFEESLPTEKRKINKHKNPITAYMHEAALNSPPLHSQINKHSSSSSSDDGEEYEMQHTPPRQQHRQSGSHHYENTIQQQRQNPSYFPTTTTTTNPISPPYPSNRTQTRSPPPPFTTAISSPPISPPSTTTTTTTIPHPQPIRQPFSPRHNNLYSSIPLTPNTPLPLLSGYPNHSSTSLSQGNLRTNTSSPTPRHFGAPQQQHHQHTNSDDCRQQLGLSVQTEFEPPPKRAKAGLKQVKIKEVKAKKVKEEKASKRR